MSECDHNSLFHTKICFIRNTLITNLIDQRSQTDGLPIKLVQGDVARLIGSALDDKRVHSQLAVCMRIELLLSQRARALIVETVSRALVTAPASCGNWRVTAEGWTTRVSGPLLFCGRALQARVMLRNCRACAKARNCVFFC
jgi:hypothetical protein